ncbi:MAG: preprotein translocase subunit YajC [Ruminococcus sp.]|nr:preprotein translocase subunit YajC [Ruminococcus sp.]MCM1381543.1 preprotein translocase subunit YajC [Muribaculaceae bacterium]MCM1478785.1 preprotein translocase subunit YajC [Muribaculaceae bacterium]
MNTALLTFMLKAAENAAPADAAQGATTVSMVSYLIMMAIIFGLMYLLMIRPQKKKEKEAKEMRDNLQIGDEVTTIGGITGIVVRKTEDTVVIETGGDRSKIRVKTWAISENATVHDAQEEIGKKK